MEPTSGFWEIGDTITSVLVNVSVLAAAVAAAIKFRVLHMLRRRYRSELLCRHYALSNGRVIFVGDYSVHNIGERPMAVSRVSLRLHPAAPQGALLVPDPNLLLAERVLEAGDADKTGLFQIEAGERSIFTLRCELPELPGVVFLLCRLSWPDRREPAPFVGMYVRTDFTINRETTA